MPADPEHSAAEADDRAAHLDTGPAFEERRREAAGNALRPAALLWTLPALLVVFLSMAADRRFELGLPVALVALLIACVGLLDALGTFDDRVVPATRLVRRHHLLRPLLLALVSCGALVASLRAAVAGVLPWPIFSAAVLVTSASVALLLSGYALVRGLGVFDDDEHPRRRLRERHGFWLLLLAILLYVPLLGSYSLIDPWETHYGEVSREMLARHDWISLWWAQEGWFWSKPALAFWLQGLAFLLFGVRYQPDAMLGSVAQGRFPQPEWAVRWPTMVLALLATYLAYKAVAHVAGRGAGLLGGLVLLTSPYWFFIAHQSMTDMPYVACLTAALALVLLGLSCDPERKARGYAVSLLGRRWTLSLVHVVLGLVLMSAVPQILYLLSRNLPLFLEAPSRGFRLQWDVFLAGSPGNCGLPGNDDCFMTEAASVIQPAMSAVLWAAALGWLLVAKRGERRVQRLYFLAAWYFAALSFLAKGAPGLVLPLVVVAVALCAARRFRDFARLELVGCALLIAAVALPWYVQAFLRHGSEFADRLLFHDMYKRAFVHVHDTNVGDDV
ncbi:MAG TPA: glycosyltransferase family 39 protein, partial [Polyangiaceae bacterium]|nr:glycosyltransferase family 39 protein [Polyangiaceae bacterium]